MLLDNGQALLTDATTSAPLGNGIAPDGPWVRCQPDWLGLDSGGHLVAVGGPAARRMSLAPRLAPHTGIACAQDAAWAITPEGELVRFARGARGWAATGQARHDALVDGHPVLAHGALWVLARASDARYRHGILGDRSEATALLRLDPASLTSRGELSLPADQVFEDLTVRVAKADGRDMLAVVRASPDGGAALALVAPEADPPAFVATGPDFGRPHRWLNPVISGHALYAVHTPHIGGTLHRYRLENDRLNASPMADGVSNHGIGERLLDIAAVIPMPGHDAVILPDASRTALLHYRCAERCERVARHPLAGKISTNLLHHDGALWIGDDGARLHRIPLASP